MKKLSLTIAVILGMTFVATAQQFQPYQQQQGGGLFGLGAQRMDNQYLDNRENESLIELPGQHGLTDDVPLGSGALLLIGFGAAYAMRNKKRK